MEYNREQLSSIMEALRSSPRGMNVTEVAKITKMHRATVAKYLEIMYVSGHVDRKLFGTSKIYYISQRMPISAFLNFSSDLIIILDKDMRVLNANDQFFEFTNTTREEVIHKNVNNMAFPLKFNPSIEPLISEAMKGTSTKLESYYQKKEKGYYFKVKFIPLVFDGGENGVIIMFEDITEKKLAEIDLRDMNDMLERNVRERTRELEKANEALRKSEAYLAEAGQIARLGYWSYNLKTNDIYSSDETCRLFGIAPGSKWDYDIFTSRVHPEDISMVERNDKEAIESGAPLNYEYRIVRPDGSIRVVHTIGEVRRDGSGTAVEIFGAIQDITERKQMDKELKKSEEKYRSILENINVMVWEIDEKCRIMYVNNKSRDILGYEPEDIIGRIAIDVMAPGDGTRLRELFMPIWDKQQPFELLDYHMFKKDGTKVYCKTNGMPLFDDKGHFKGYRGVTREIANGK